jgi:hypothetical protein
MSGRRKPLSQKSAKELLEEHGWTETKGGKHSQDGQAGSSTHHFADA